MALQQYSKHEKNQIVIETIKGQQTAADLSSGYGIHTGKGQSVSLPLFSFVEMYRRFVHGVGIRPTVVQFNRAGAMWTIRQACERSAC